MDNETGQTYASSKQKASEAPHFQPRESVELPEEQIEHQQKGGGGNEHPQMPLAHSTDGGFSFSSQTFCFL